jgi:hypothetical protein
MSIYTQFHQRVCVCMCVRVSILTPSSNGMQERKAQSIRNRKPCLHTCLVFSICTHALQRDINVVYMLQHNSAINISSTTLKIFYKFPRFQPTLHNCNRAILERCLALHTKCKLALNTKAAVFAGVGWGVKKSYFNP